MAAPSFDAARDAWRRAGRQGSPRLFSLLARPDQLEAVRADRSLIPQAIEEAVRYEAPLLNITRLATRDTVLGACPSPRDRR
jgi:cytochrome P450